jgi:drug/metabolite transporter (DMT)-like permease
MGMNQILGAVILVVGVIVLGFAFNAADAPVEKVSETLTGKYTDQTMLYFILGGVAAVGGGLLFAFGQRR